jgi:proteasome lid subunit RPN8/RPN11
VCGILIGDSESASTGPVVRELRAAENVAPGDRRRRFAIAPRTLLKAQQEARAAGMEVIGYYHSHPDSPAVPSAVDLEAAWPGVSYLIASLAGGDLELRGWRLDPASTTFSEERIELVGS